MRRSERLSTNARELSGSTATSRAVAPIHHQHGITVRSSSREDGLASRRRPTKDGARFNVNRNERVHSRRRRVNAIAVWRKIQCVGKRPHRDSRGHLPHGMIRAWIEDPHVAARRADTKNLWPRRVLPHPGNSGPDSNPRHGLELHQVYDGHVAVRRRDVCREVQIRLQERRPMLAQQQNQSGDTKNSNQEVGAEVFRPVHVGKEIVPRFDERSKVAAKNQNARCP
ncbi:MAG: hypothetical protein AUH16_00775 [Acidobacteria bacterium 13_2_20CM_57_7]|nr:MAG: hypothetical protein AUH16_00775 [Acidobacteria bacterium 13_2_20CM_57_7]